MADNCDDVVTVLDALGVDRFVAAGWSGGGPHARLADVRTHLLPDDGHFSIPLGRLDEVFAEVRSMLAQAG